MDLEVLELRVTLIAMHLYQEKHGLVIMTLQKSYLLLFAIYLLKHGVHVQQEPLTKAAFLCFYGDGVFLKSSTVRAVFRMHIFSGSENCCHVNRHLKH